MTTFASATFLVFLLKGERAGKSSPAATVLHFWAGELRGETPGKPCGGRGADFEDDREIRVEQYDELLGEGGCEDEGAILEPDEPEYVFVVDDDLWG
jgi:hypothetical protein